MCLGVRSMSMEARRGHQNPWNCSYRAFRATMWVLGIVPGSSGRAATSLAGQRKIFRHSYGRGSRAGQLHSVSPSSTHFCIRDSLWSKRVLSAIVCAVQNCKRSCPWTRIQYKQGAGICGQGPHLSHLRGKFCTVSPGDCLGPEKFNSTPGGLLLSHPPAWFSKAG